MNDSERARWQLYIRERIKIDPATGCWVWQLGCLGSGYGHSSNAFHFGHDSRAHRLSYVAFIGPIPEGLLVRHQCHNRACCNPGHLLVGTHQENKDDNKRDGLRHPNAVLDPAKAAEIKRLLALRIYTQQQIGLMFGVKQITISRVARGTLWADIQPATTKES